MSSRFEVLFRLRQHGTALSPVFVFSLSERKNEIGLSLTDAVQCFVCHVFVRLGENMTHNKQKVP